MGPGFIWFTITMGDVTHLIPGMDPKRDKRDAFVQPFMLIPVLSDRNHKVVVVGHRMYTEG